MSVIGEGTYGCVHEPSLKCESSELINYENKVSKLLSKNEANKELKEYSILKKIDPNQKYYLGVPVKCNVKDNYENINSINKCKNSNKFIRNINNMRLLIMTNGGSNINDLLMTLNNKNKNNRENLIEIIFIYLYEIFNAIKLFNLNKVTHRDIKSENIVFDLTKNKIRIIDFGMMNTFNNLINDSKNNYYNFDVLHWSLAPYSLFINKENFENVQKYGSNNTWFEDFLKRIRFENDEQMTFFYNRISKNNLFLETNIKKNLKNQYHETVRNLNKISHEDFLKKVFSLLDIHNLGITLLHVTSIAKEYYNNKELINRFKNLGLKMISLNIFNHVNIQSACIEYENILNNSNILSNQNLKIHNNEIIILNKKNKGSESKNINKLEKSTIKSILKKLETNIVNARINKKVQFKSNTNKIKEGKMLNQNTDKFIDIPKVSVKKTPEGKMLNPKTGRYINIPKKTKKHTPPGKMLNPKTGRYINIPKKTKKHTANLEKLLKILKNKTCPPGKILNSKTRRCIKIKANTKKQKNKTNKICPPGKILNEKTNRCIDEFKRKNTYYK